MILGGTEIEVIDPPGAGLVVIDAPDYSLVPIMPIGGPAGATGPAGGATFTVTAGTVLSGHRVVRAQPDGSLVYASNAVYGDALADLFLTTQAAGAGTPITVQALGLVTEPSWSWASGPVWLGADGVLTQAQPVAPAFLRQVGSASAPTSLYFNPRPAFVLV